jgi:hypothetical protein
VPKRRPPDPRGAHVRIYWDILDSHAWNALNYSQRALYVACRRKLKSTNNGNLAFTLADLRENGFNSSSTLASGLRALLAVGLIAVTREGGRVARGQTIPVLYRFTDDPSHQWMKHDIPAYSATHEWRRFESVEEAANVIAQAEVQSRQRHAARKEKTGVTTEHEKKSSIRKSNRNDSKSEYGTIRNPNSVTSSKFENRIDNT